MVGKIINSRPIAFMAFFSMLGIAFAYYLNWTLFPLVCILAIGVAVFVVLYVRCRTTSMLLVYFVVFLLAASIFSAQYHTDIPPVQDGQVYTVQGKVVDRSLGDMNRYTIKNVKVGDGDAPRPIRKHIYVYSKDVVPAGYLVEFQSKINLPSAARNPGGFDEKMYSASRRLAFSCFAQNLDVTKKGFTPNAFFLNIRETLAKKIDTYFMQSTSSTAKAMFLGIKSDLDDEVSGLFENIGVAHVLALSGLHVAVISALFQKIAKKLHISRNVRIPINMIVLVLYMLVVGFAPSIVRAVLMSLFMLAGRWWFKKRDTLTFLAASMLIILVVAPAQLFMPGFLLSYGVVFGMLCLVPPLIRVLDRLPLPKWIGAMLANSIAAAIAVLPLTAYYFKSISIISVLTNLYALPLTGIIVAGVAVFCLFSWLPPVAALLAIVPQLFIEVFLQLNVLLSSIGWGQMAVQSFPAVAGVLIFGALFICSDYIMVKLKTKFIISLVLFSAAAVGWGIRYREHNDYLLKMTVLDVGQGDVMHLDTGQYSVLIDNGGQAQYSQLTAYTNNNMVTYDAVVITNDRTRNLEQIMQTDAVKRLYVPPNYMPKAYDDSVPVIEYQMYDKIMLGDEHYLQIVATDGKNISLELGKGTQVLCLLMQNNADEIAKDYPTQVPIIKLAKGGERQSVTVRMARALRPQTAIISVKNDSTGELPDIGVRSILIAEDVDYYQTNVSGAITILWNQQGEYCIQTMK